MIAKTRVLAVLKTSLALFQVQRIFTTSTGHAAVLYQHSYETIVDFQPKIFPTLGYQP